MKEQRIALAIQKPANEPGKKNVGDETEEILRAGGLVFRRTPRVDFASTNIEGLYIWDKKNGDIAEDVARGEVMMAVLGEDKLGEYYGSNPPLVIRELGFSLCALKIGVTKRKEFGGESNRGYRKPKDLIDKIIVTNYPRGTARWLDQYNIPWKIANGVEVPPGFVRINRVEGGGESRVNWGSAQACVEISDTGTSMLRNNIRILKKQVLESQAVLVVNPELRTMRGSERIVWQTLRKIMTGLWKTRYTMLEINYPKTKEEIVLGGLPARESPTKSTLEDPNWGAAKVLIRADEVSKWVQRLLEKGARDAVLQQVELVIPNLNDPEVTRMMRAIYGEEWKLPNPPYPI